MLQRYGGDMSMNYLAVKSLMVVPAALRSG